jgi:hypothetical protein
MSLLGVNEENTETFIHEMAQLFEALRYKH